jgi:hypothetical protein
MTRKRTSPRPCPTCSTLYEKKPHEVRMGAYCSPRCRLIAKTGEPAFEIIEDGLSARIPLRARDDSIRAYTIVDMADAEWASRWRWSLDKNGYVTRKQYFGGGLLTRRMVTFRFHRELMGLTPDDGLEVDHRDLDKLNNRRSNLRVVTHAEQMQNRPSLPGSSSQYRGVHWDKSRKKWVVTVGIDGMHHQIGRFDDEHQAGEAARVARAKLLPFATN